ncbi:amidohydrolase/deacetylase family metallohydrolase [Jiangella gansuensis]|uniref:amidohydrolase/deacetylase family metallohydrolase n=1 Tax=Jiangella gansuensis TaxID=281473 RepID=UPI0012F83301|nr:amidohydrolase/deacetylase family metallohydrolase [Jiangella gansuensis]
MNGHPTPDVDLAIVNGRVYTPEGFADASVGIRDGRIAYVGDPATAPPARDTVDADGALVVPGLIDLHTHVYLGSARLGVNPDKTAARSGVTTWVDAGTSGAGTFEGLLLHVRDRSRARVVPFLNMSYIGLAPAGMLTREVGELWDPAFADLRAVLRAAEEFPGEIKGIKVRASSNALGDNAPVVLPQAREAADELQVPLMIHIGMAPPTLPEVLPYLRAGDLLTHCFHPHAGGRIIGSDGRVRPEVRDAVARGVLLDVGHGVASMSHRVTQQALDEGLLPDSLSSDLHAENVGGPVKSMLTVMEMFLALGMPLEEVLDRSTRRPAAAISRPDLGRLEPGATGDVAVLALEPTDRWKQDSTGVRIQLTQRFVHRLTVVGGEILAPFDDGRNEFRSSPWLSKFGATEDDDH